MPPKTISSSAAPKPILDPYRHFVIGAVVYLLILQCMALFPSIPGSLAGNADFRNLYTAGYIVRTGAAHRLYDYDFQGRMQSMVTPRAGLLPFVYPAYTALLFVPLSFFGYRAAYALFFAVNLLLLWLSAKLMRSSLPHLAELWLPLPWAVFFCFLPATVALMHGQTSILLLALFCAAYSWLKNGKPFRAGVILGLGILKIQLTLPVWVLLVLWRRWRAAAGFLAGAAVALIASLCVTGYPAFVQYWRSLFSTAAGTPGTVAPLALPPSMMANLYGFGQLLSGGAAWGARLAAIASLLVLLWMASQPASLPMATAGALLISRYMGMHDMALLLLPIAFVLDQFVADPRDSRARAGAIVSLILCFPPVYLLTMGRHLFPLLALILLAFVVCLAKLKLEPSAETRASVGFSREAV